MITIRDVKQAFGTLQVAGFSTPPEWDQMDQDRIVREWGRDLQNLTPPQLNEAVRRWKTSGEKFWPRPGQLLELVKADTPRPDPVPYGGRQACAVCHAHTPGTLHLHLPVEGLGGAWALELVDLPCPCRGEGADRTRKVLERWGSPAFQARHHHLIDETPPSERPGSNSGDRRLAREALYNAAKKAARAMGVDVHRARNYERPRYAPDGQPLPPVDDEAA